MESASLFFFLRFQTCEEHEIIGALSQQAHAHSEQKNNGAHRPLAALMPSSFIHSIPRSVATAKNVQEITHIKDSIGCFLYILPRPSLCSVIEAQKDDGEFKTPDLRGTK